MAVFCVEGRLQCVVEGREYRIGSGDFFVYMPGQVIGEILLSQHADVKVIAFAQRVKDESGRSPLDLIHETTVSTIRQQLRYSNKTVKEICNELDFPTLSFFGKFVREHLGMSPTEYRQQNLNNGC